MKLAKHNLYDLDLFLYCYVWQRCKGLKSYTPFSKFLCFNISCNKRVDRRYPNHNQR